MNLLDEFEARPETYGNGWRPIGVPLSLSGYEDGLEEILGEALAKWLEPSSDKMPPDIWTSVEVNEEIKALNDTPCFAPTLNVAIHPIVARENFFSLSEEAYNNLTPMLQLITLFLTHDATVIWLHTLVSCPIKQAGRTDVVYVNIRRPSITPLEASRRVAIILETLALDIDFAFLPARKDADIGPAFAKNGVLKMFHVLGRQEPKYRLRILRESLITLPGNIREVASRADFGLLPMGQKLRFWFQNAVNMTHEIVHAFWTLNAQRFMPDWQHHDQLSRFSMSTRNNHFKTAPEPRFPRAQRIPELGWSWENAIIGKYVYARFNILDGSESLYWWKDMEAGIVPMDWIEQWFQRQTWDSRLGHECLLMQAALNTRLLRRPDYRGNPPAGVALPVSGGQYLHTVRGAALTARHHHHHPRRDDDAAGQRRPDGGASISRYRDRRDDASTGRHHRRAGRDDDAEQRQPSAEASSTSRCRDRRDDTYSGRHRARRDDAAEGRPAAWRMDGLG